MHKVIIFYNPILDEMTRAHCLAGRNPPERVAQKTDIVFVEGRIKEYRKLWSTFNDKVFAAIEKMTGRPFLNRCVMVNVVWACRTTESGGMIFPVNHNPDNFVLTLMHELMHLSGGIFTDEFNEKYKNETLVARTHIVVNAMTEYLWRDVIGKPEYVDLHKERCKKNKAIDHLRGWEIVDEVGYKKIVDSYLDKSISKLE